MRGQQTEFRSTDASQMQAWVQTNTGIGIQLRTQPSPSIRLVGARLVGNGATPAVEISYKAGHHDALLLVSKAQPTLPSDFRHSASAGVRVVSWTMHGQRYLLSCSDPGDLRIACLLCHT
jgi:hypothetical protein